MTLPTSWTQWRARGAQQLAVTLALFLAGFYVLPTSKAVNNVYYALVLAPALLLLRSADWRWLAGSWLWRAAMALLAYLTLSGLWTEHASWSDWLSQAKALPYLAVYLALVACVFARRVEAARWLIGAVVIAAALGTVISAVRFYSVAAWPLRLEYASAIYNANEGATAAGSALLLAVFWLAPTSDSRWQRALWLACAMTLLAGMVLSGSRTPLVAVVVSLLLGLALCRQWRLLALAVALVGVTVVAGINSSAGRQALLRGDSYRLAIWQYYATRAAQHPWFGEGVLTDDTSRAEFHGPGGVTFNALHAHDVYLATTLYGGLPALILLVSVIALAIRDGGSLARRGEPAWLLVLVFGLLCMLTDGDRLLHSPRAIWVYFWLPIGALIGVALAPAPVETTTRGKLPSAWPADRYRSE